MAEIKSGVYIWLIILVILGILICAAIVRKFKSVKKTTTEIMLAILAVLI